MIYVTPMHRRKNHTYGESKTVQGTTDVGWCSIFVFPLGNNMFSTGTHTQKHREQKKE